MLLETVKGHVFCVESLSALLVPHLLHVTIVKRFDILFLETQKGSSSFHEQFLTEKFSLAINSIVGSVFEMWC